MPVELRKWARVHVQAYEADAMVKDLADLNMNLRGKLDHEHNQRVREKADAKVALTEATSKAAVDLAETKADFRAALAQAEAQGAARGEEIGYQRAMKETEIYDAGFEGGKQQGRNIAARKKSRRTPFPQAQFEMPLGPTNSQGHSLGFEGPSPPWNPSFGQGGAASHVSSKHNGRSSQSRNPAGGYDGPTNIGQGSKKPSAHNSKVGSIKSKASGVKHSQFESGSEKPSLGGSKAGSASHSRKSEAGRSQHAASSKHSSSHNVNGGSSRHRTLPQGGSSKGGRPNSHASRKGWPVPPAASSTQHSSGSGTIRPSYPQPHTTRSGNSHSVAMNSSARRAPMSSLAHSSVNPSSSVSQISSVRRSQLQRHAETLYGDEYDEDDDDYDDGTAYDDGEYYDLDHGLGGWPY